MPETRRRTTATLIFILDSEAHRLLIEDSIGAVMERLPERAREAMALELRSQRTRRLEAAARADVPLMIPVAVDYEHATELCRHMVLGAIRSVGPDELAGIVIDMLALQYAANDEPDIELETLLAKFEHGPLERSEFVSLMCAALQIHRKQRAESEGPTSEFLRDEDTLVGGEPELPDDLRHSAAAPRKTSAKGGN